MRYIFFALLLILSLRSLALADNVQDFEIDGMSIGDSLIEYKSLNEIEKAVENKMMYPDSNFAVIVFNPNTKQPYDYIEIVYDITNKEYIIDALTGLVNYPNSYDKCKINKINISNEFKLIFNDAKIYENESPHYYFPDSIVDQIDFYPKSGGFVRVSCTDWSEKLFKENEWVDNLKVSIGSKKFSEFLN
tara:strand:- start:310 stop:879 length:570 start_codon:yes stop_codon:yes gene_type:complete